MDKTMNGKEALVIVSGADMPLEFYNRVAVGELVEVRQGVTAQLLNIDNGRVLRVTGCNEKQAGLLTAVFQIGEELSECGLERRPGGAKNYASVAVAPPLIRRERQG